jgi:hypothetical protein
MNSKEQEQTKKNTKKKSIKLVCCALQNSKTCKQMKHLQNIYQDLGPLSL